MHAFTSSHPARAHRRHGRSARTHRAFGTVAGAAAVAIAALLGPLGLAMPVTPAAAANEIAFWLTDSNHPTGSRLERKSNVSWGSSAGANAEITINPSQTFQNVVGFGASITDSTSYNINEQLSPAERDRWFDDLFTRKTDASDGIGLTWLRQPLGASDYIGTDRSQVPATGSKFYTYQDDPAHNVNIAADQRSINDVKRALSINPDITVMGSPWSAPGWMRQTNSLLGHTGGELRQNQENAYAEYLREVVQQYQNQGVPLRYLSLQNEPEFTPSYPGMYMSPGQQARLANLLAPKLNNAGLNTGILGWDHNWDKPNYPTAVLNNAGNSVVGTAWHCYAINTPDMGGSYQGGTIVDAGAQTQVRNQFPNKDVFFTECSGTEAGSPQQTFSDTAWWHMSLYAIPAMRNWSKSLSFWNLALDQNSGPYPPGYNICPNCSGITTVNTGSKTYTRGAGYFVLGHFSKFVVPGAVRVGSSERVSSVSNVAFRNPDGTYALVVHNGGGAQVVGVTVNGQRFTQNLQANAIATFTWGTPTTPDPDTAPDPVVSDADGPVGAIVNPSSAKCIDLAAGSETKANGTSIQLWECNGTVAQRWQRRTLDSTIRVRGKCLTTASDADNAVVQLWDCTTAGRVKAWTLNPGRLRSPGGRCIAVPGNSSNNGVQLQLRPCDSSSGQQWLTPSRNVTGRTEVKSVRAPARCVGAGGSATGTPVSSVLCTSAPKLDFAADNSLRLGDKCLAPRAEGSTTAVADGDKIRLAYCTGQSAQKWQVQSGRLHLLGTNFCLDLTDGVVDSAVQLQVWECVAANDNDNQKWTVTTTPPTDDGGPSDPDGPGNPDPDNPDGPGDPGGPGGPGDPDGPGGPGDPDGPGGPGGPGDPDGPGGPGNPDEPDNPGNPGSPGNPGGGSPSDGSPSDSTTPPVVNLGDKTTGGTPKKKAKSRIAKVTIMRGKAKKRAIRVNRAARIRVVVRAKPVTRTTGVVRLRVGGKVIGKAKLRAKAKKSVATIRIKAKKNTKTGKIRVVYAGSRTATKVASKTKISVRQLR